MAHALDTAVAELVARYRGGTALVLLFDYDGTLAPLAAHPTLARVPTGTRRALATLARRPRVTVGVVSSRGLADVERMLGLPGLVYAGSGGLELEIRGRSGVAPGADHLAGFAGTKPVRIGNAAFDQKQNDLNGEMVLCLETLLGDPRIVANDAADVLRLVERLVDDAIAAYPSADTGIWEFRTLLRHHTFSKVLGLVAAHRGAELARFHGRTDLADRWQRWADDEHPRLLDAAYNPTLGFFTQALGGQSPDAANLLLATLGFVDARDPRFVATVRACERLLVVS